MQATMDNQRKQAIQEMKTIPSNSIGGQVRKDYLVHLFDNDMHHDCGSIGSGNPLTNEVNSGEDDKGTFWCFLIVKPTVLELVEVFRSKKPKLCSTRRREEKMDTKAAPSLDADPELLATVRVLTTSILTMHIGQRRTDHFCRQLRINNSKTNSSYMIVLRGFPYCGLHRHRPPRPMRCFFGETHLASQLPNKQHMPLVGGGIPKNIVSIDDSDDYNLIWDKPNSNG
jgi:hypothetical protein